MKPITIEQIRVMLNTHLRKFTEDYVKLLHRFITRTFDPLLQASHAEEYAMYATDEDIEKLVIRASPAMTILLNIQEQEYDESWIKTSESELKDVQAILGNPKCFNVKKKTCPICKSTDTTVKPIQTRSSDEPTRNLDWCLKCNRSF